MIERNHYEDAAVWRQAGLKRARQLAKLRPLRLNLGSGFRPRSGWINVDLGDGSDLALDLRERLPFDDNSVEAIYTEHFFEHLDYPNLDDASGWQIETATRSSDALTFLRECRRVLVPERHHRGPGRRDPRGAQRDEASRDDGRDPALPASEEHRLLR